MDLIDSVSRDAIEALRRCCTPQGLKASGRSVGHHQIWARDSIIASLGARLANDGGIQAALRAGLRTLRDCQVSNGAIPNNVDCATLHPNFRAYADGGLWWIIGSALLEPDPATVRAILRWYECQDVDQSGLLSMQESSDWQDLFCTRGKGLYLNCLYVLALRAAAELFESSDPAESRRCLFLAGRAADAVNRWFWYAGDGNLLRHISHTFSTESQGAEDSLGRKRWFPEKRCLAGESYYLPYLGFRAAGEWFDSLGNLLAILAGIADSQRTAGILSFFTRHALDLWPVRSLTPVVQPGDPDWRDYYGSLNAPYCYHNGGVWPFIGGFYVAALTAAGCRHEAAEALQRLAELNRRGEFNEWHHGESGEPMGVRDQAWSAGMYLVAWDSVRRGRVALVATAGAGPECGR
ncbi:MAG TPA: glycoside hydrolase 100 family protein [Candidatus Acidoferrales bacterium]|nr:glycoside hydrolase 100 family protein [Candidatus Acidoferrales bacterium]